MARERALIVSRVRIEKFDDNMDLVDIHESKVPTITAGEINSGVKKEENPSENDTQDKKEKDPKGK